MFGGAGHWLIRFFNLAPDKDDRARWDALYPLHHVLRNSSFFLVYDALYGYHLLPKHNEGQRGTHLANSMDATSESDVLTDTFQRYGLKLDSLLVLAIS